MRWGYWDFCFVEIFGVWVIRNCCINFVVVIGGVLGFGFWVLGVWFWGLMDGGNGSEEGILWGRGDDDIEWGGY